MVPTFDGDCRVLSNYIEAYEFLIWKFLRPNPNDREIAIELLMLFKGKLTGLAREAINANKKPTDWPSLKAFLIHNFGDKRSESIMCYDLNNTLPKSSENIQNYAARIKATLYALLGKINMEENDENRKIIKIEEYNHLALQTFLCGIYMIDKELTQEVKMRNPADIETAGAFALEIENFNTLQRRKMWILEGSCWFVGVGESAHRVGYRWMLGLCVAGLQSLMQALITLGARR